MSTAVPGTDAGRFRELTLVGSEALALDGSGQLTLDGSEELTLDGSGN